VKKWECFDVNCYWKMWKNKKNNRNSILHYLVMFCCLSNKPTISSSICPHIDLRGVHNFLSLNRNVDPRAWEPTTYAWGVRWMLFSIIRWTATSRGLFIINAYNILSLCFISSFTSNIYINWVDLWFLKSELIFYLVCKFWGK
jgi:hypothetical protein